MLTPDRLRSLVKEATRPWRLSYKGTESVADARLIALAPQLAELVADMAEAAQEYRYAVRPDPHDYHERQVAEDLDTVLDRLAALFPEDSA